MGTHEKDFAKPLEHELNSRYSGPSTLVFESVHWAPVLNNAEDNLWKRVTKTHDLDFVKLRKFVVSALGDSIAYQPLRKGAEKTKNVYDEIHRVFADTLKRLAQQVDPKTPS